MRVETTRVARRHATELTWRSAAMVALIIVLLVSLISMSIAALAPRSSPTSAAGVPAQPGSLTWNGRGQVNVLLLGFDSPMPDSSTLSSVMICSYSPSTGTERLLSIPVSLWVTVPGFGQDTLSNAYADGGARLALLVTQSVTHLVIPYYLAMGQDGLRQLVDAYGGVTVSDPSFVTAKDPWGTRHLSGGAALSYVKGVATGPSADITRFPRVQKLFAALQHKSLQPEALFQVAANVNSLGGSIDTNFPFSQVPVLARQLSSVPVSHIKTGSLDYGTGAVANYKANGTQVLLPDWQRIHTLVGELFGPPAVTGSLQVMNGSGATGAAAGLTSWFRQLGVHVGSFGSADSFNYAHTQVVINTRASARNDQLARVAATLLQAPTVTRAVRYSRAPVIVLIGADFQSPLQQ